MAEEDLPQTEIETAPTPQQVGLPDDFIREIQGLLDENHSDLVEELCRDLAASDAAELIVKLDRARRHKLSDILEKDIHPETFSYLPPEVMNDLLEHMSPLHIASIVNNLESDDAIHMIENLDEDRRGDILHHLHRHLRVAVEESLTYPEYSAGRLMQREFVAVPQFWTVGKSVDYLRAASNTLPEKFYNIFIVDALHRFVGTVTLNRLLCAQRAVKVDTLVTEERITIPVAMEQKNAALLFSRKDLLSAPVVDEDERIIGVITVDDIVDVIHEEAEEDILSLSGVEESDIHRPIFATARSRFFWLAINLVTAILAASVINIFKPAIEKTAALAVLMPIVAGMGGNAGGQTLAVAVRALATKDLSSANSMRVILKESAVGLANGAAFGILMGLVVYLWFHSATIGIAIACAMIMNMIAAGFSGAFIPLLMQRLGHDPASSAVVFLTTVTDITGFCAFLGLASWLLN